MSQWVALIIVGFLLSCTSPQKSKLKSNMKLVNDKELIGNEGFYNPDQLPSAFLPLFPSHIEKQIRSSTGAIFVGEKEKTYSAKDIMAEYEKRCENSQNGLWNHEFCKRAHRCISQDLNQCLMNGSKRIVCAAGIIHYQSKIYALTSQHCLFHPALQDKGQTFLRIRGEEKPILDFKATPVTKSNSNNYGLALYEIEKWPKERPAGTISTRTIEKNEPVIQAGFPYFVGRTEFNGSYDRTAAGLKLTLGKVTEPNPLGLSYCEFSNDITLSSPESWHLKKYCPKPEELMKNANYAAVIGTPAAWTFPKEEKDPFLTNTDMINGMSGGPLFDQEGKIIGIGNTVKKNGPPLNYDSKYPAIFSKAKNIAKIL